MSSRFFCIVPHSGVLGLPLLHIPCWWHSSERQVMLVTGFLKVWPIHFQFPLLLVNSILCWLVRWHRFSFEILLKKVKQMAHPKLCNWSWNQNKACMIVELSLTFNHLCVAGCGEHDFWCLQLQASKKHFTCLSSSGADRVRFACRGGVAWNQMSCYCGERSTFWNWTGADETATKGCQESSTLKLVQNRKGVRWWIFRW